MKPEKSKSKLAMAIESRVRKVHEFEVHGFFGLGEKPIHKIAIWVNVKAEQDRALAAAYEVVKGLTQDAEARKDEDLLIDAKTTQILFNACRRCEEGDDDKNRYPAFPSPEWMRKHLTTDQLAVLLNLYHEVRRREAPVPWEIDHAQVMANAKLCADHFGTDLPDTLLAVQSREWLTQAFILLAKEYQDVQGDAEHEIAESGAPEAPEDP